MVKSLKSVGIDIGSTTTQLVFSNIEFDFIEKTNKLEIVDRKIIYYSDIFMTPFNANNYIDIRCLSSILNCAYKKAGYKPEDVETGAIIITGEAARKKNSKKIINFFAEQMGKFVCAIVGPNFETILAAHGSGSLDLSKKQKISVMNVDIGGGTSKIAILKNGQVMDMASIYIGARCIVLDSSNRIIRIENPAKIISKVCDIPISLNKILLKTDQHKLARAMANCLLEVMKRGRLSDLTEQLMITKPLNYKGLVNTIVFSGGVAEYIYSYEEKNFGDLGKILGEEIISNIRNMKTNLSEPRERIRATVIGVSQYTLQISGSTNFISNINILPIKNIPIVAPKIYVKNMSIEDIVNAINSSLKMYDIVIGEDQVALAFSRSVINQPSYNTMKTLAEAIISTFKVKIKNKQNIVLIFEADIGRGIGRIISEDLSTESNLISIDEIVLNDFNYIDIGKPTKETGLIPVIIKSLVFPT
jgi:ethanolamine utilization protein EutA